MTNEVLSFIYSNFVLRIKCDYVCIITDDKEKCSAMNVFFSEKVKVTLFVVDEMIEELIISDNRKIYILCFFYESKTNFFVANKIELSGSYCLYFEWNIDKYSESAQIVLKKIYSKAILTDYSQMKKINRKFANSLKKDDKVRIVSKCGTDIEFRIGSSAHEENCDIISERIVQLPGGEVFWLPVVGSCNGVIKTTQLAVHVKNDMVEDINGECMNKKIPVCEFGLGSNINVKMLDGLVFSEKAWQTCHFGVGSNINLGGYYKLNFHFDIVINEFQIFVNGDEIILNE